MVLDFEYDNPPNEYAADTLMPIPFQSSMYYKLVGGNTYQATEKDQDNTDQNSVTNTDHNPLSDSFPDTVEFPGTIIFTDEDRTFTNKIANRIMEIATDGMVDRISGYEEFLSNETVLQQIREKYNPGE